jgi:peroxiredoxin
MKKFLITLILLVTVCVTNAQQIADFSLKNVITGATVSLDTYPSCAGLLVIFTSNSCAYDEYYRGRINALSKQYADRVPVLLINSGIEAIESVDNMVRKAQQLGLTVPYLADKDQKVMRQFGATKTPQAFLLKNNSGKFTLVFKGAIDDNPQVQSDVRHAYLKDAIDIMLTNQKIETPEVRPIGCSIRKQ